MLGYAKCFQKLNQLALALLFVLHIADTVYLAPCYIKLVEHSKFVRNTNRSKWSWKKLLSSQLALRFANPIKSETARSKLLKFLPGMENLKKTRKMQNFFFAKNRLVRFCKMTAALRKVARRVMRKSNWDLIKLLFKPRNIVSSKTR